MKHLFSLISLIFLLAIAAAPISAEDVYRWVDDEGVTHFTAQPPKNRKSERVRTQTGHSEPVDYSHFGQDDADTETNDNQAPNRETQPTRDSQRCQNARDNLQVLETGGRIAEEDENGERRYLDEEAQRQRAEQARRIIAEHC